MTDTRSIDVDRADVRCPVHFVDLVHRLNGRDEYLPSQGMRLIYQKERQCYRLVDLGKARPMTAQQIEKFARELGALTDDETMIGA